MPIAYACPHCGKQFSVAEQYAGQTGPCAACGKPITIPPVAGPYAYAPQAGARGSGGGGAVVVIIAVVGCVLVCGGILVALLLPALAAARAAARRSQSMNNLKQIGIALHNYHDTFGSFPPAVVASEDGQPLYSGRVLLLPFMEQAALYDQFDLKEPWDSPKNLTVSQTMLSVFLDPAATNRAAGQTDYLFVTGKGTIFEGDTVTKIREITDGTSNTIMAVEVKNAGASWAQPKDVDISQAMALPPGNHPGGNLAAFADGSVRFLSKALPAQTVRDVATKGGAEMVNLP